MVAGCCHLFNYNTMIHFNELYVTEDGKHLVVDAEIDANSAYDGCYIDAITVDLGTNCEGNGFSSNAVKIYDGTRVVGDLTGSYTITESDVKMWHDLLCLTSRRLKQSSDCNYYYDDEDEFGNPTVVYVDSKVPSIMEYVATHYVAINTHQTFAVPNQPADDSGFVASKLFQYIVDILGNNTIEGVSMEFVAQTNSWISPINRFIEYLEDIVTNRISASELMYTSKKDTHIHICAAPSDLVPLLDAKEKDLSKYIFIVTATANCADADIVAIERLGCSSDVNGVTGVAYNGKPLYDAAINYASAFGDTCDTNDASAFNDFLMRYYGFLFALKCGDLCTAQYYWENYLMGSTSSRRLGRSNPCGCHGTYR